MKEDLLTKSQFACSLGNEKFRKTEQVDFLFIDLKEAKAPELLEARKKIEEALNRILES